jgi:hypothetical protein
MERAWFRLCHNPLLLTLDAHIDARRLAEFEIPGLALLHFQRFSASRPQSIRSSPRTPYSTFRC